MALVAFALALTLADPCQAYRAVGHSEGYCAAEVAGCFK